MGIYNTQQVADELRYIEENIQPQGETGSRRILITGSTAGLGQLAAAYLLRRGHRVVAHARNAQRAADVRRDLPGLESVVIGDLLNLDETRALASQINELGAFDIIIHNSGEYGLPNAEILNANSLSPYLLTCLVDAPREVLVYLTSDLHRGGNLKLDEIRGEGTNVNYNDSKLHMAVLATAIARRHSALRVNAVAPGWVPTVMGFHNGPYAPDDLRAGYMTQVWLAEGTDPASRITGRYLFHQKEDSVHADVYDEAAQDALLAAFAERTGVSLG
ncbi:SDR family NAD(P)-dependent oxidoreductase [Pleomorphomonas carboxyditropha]|uniref:SDR family NAD(P)-dependent oxidoreductase n=1 Tax=Pleomorphomonas carboxyditropha TaxID=2023338 RepID=UPI0013FDED7D|nr:SDR family NAD(P)-dependent oxidoreductase [Pleomorphomonas carboxyditropha]